jgi:hypothetical protein
MGMRKDFILNEKEKQRRKKRPEENRNIPSEHSTTVESVSQTPDKIDRVSLS